MLKTRGFGEKDGASHGTRPEGPDAVQPMTAERRWTESRPAPADKSLVVQTLGETLAGEAPAEQTLDTG